MGQGSVSYSIKGKSKEIRTERNPGPGAYEVSELHNRDKSPSYKMGTSSRTSIVNNLLQNMPGPGNYTQSSLFGKSGPKFTMNGKIDQKVKN